MIFQANLQRCDSEDVRSQNGGPEEGKLIPKTAVSRSRREYSKNIRGKPHPSLRRDWRNGPSQTESKPWQKFLAVSNSGMTASCSGSPSTFTKFDARMYINTLVVISEPVRVDHSPELKKVGPPTGAARIRTGSPAKWFRTGSWARYNMSDCRSNGYSSRSRCHLPEQTWLPGKPKLYLFRLIISIPGQFIDRTVHLVSSSESNRLETRLADMGAQVANDHYENVTESYPFKGKCNFVQASPIIMFGWPAPSADTAVQTEMGILGLLGSTRWIRSLSTQGGEAMSSRVSQDISAVRLERHVLNSSDPLFEGGRARPGQLRLSGEKPTPGTAVHAQFVEKLCLTSRYVPLIFFTFLGVVELV
ncbi:unnamed protein product [Nesidiocoris tenuis]|uniref:Uncharacterized protein n=1 Tax=Nesidiocoris tenuis TaxID=355587 RepID=A0A6H5GLU3_9HEMI|nr:unnamed protein product [Nesidiocoris tenuis]